MNHHQSEYREEKRFKGREEVQGLSPGQPTVWESGGCREQEKEADKETAGQ